MKRVMALTLFLAMIISTAGCSIKTGLEDEEKKFTVAMVTDTGGVNDQSFNSSAWEGMSKFAENTGSKARYIESSQASDYLVNIDRLADENCDLIWGIGFALSDVVQRAAKTNPELNYAIADYSFGDKTPENITGVFFRAEESAFVVGFIAGMTTKTDSVGFVGGIKGSVIDQFEYGYRAGVVYASKLRGKSINIRVQYAESFSDAAKGKAIASLMYSNGCDVVLHAAGGAGVGVIEAAKEAGKFAIGADLDQSYLAPNNVLTSAMKNVGKAVEIVSTKALSGEKTGGKDLSFGIKEDCVGIPDENPNVAPDVVQKAKELEEKIGSGEIKPPNNLESYNEFIKAINVKK